MGKVVNHKPGSEHEMQSPWVCYANSVRELFKLDPEIKMSWSDETLELVIKVSNPLKASAIRMLLPEEKHFGKVTVTIDVSYENEYGGDNYVPELVVAALKGNELFKYQYAWADEEATNNPLCWVAMDNRVIMYPNDDLHNTYGDRAVLPETLATEVLGEQTDHIFFCTANPERPIPEGAIVNE